MAFGAGGGSMVVGTAQSGFGTSIVLSHTEHFLFPNKNLRASMSLPRSPPRPSPGSLHYSDEDVTKYNDLIPAESSSLTEKPSEISDSQVRHTGRLEGDLPWDEIGPRGPKDVTESNFR